jgi:hypothetical protein
VTITPADDDAIARVSEWRMTDEQWRGIVAHVPELADARSDIESAIIDFVAAEDVDRKIPTPTPVRNKLIELAEAIKNVDRLLPLEGSSFAAMWDAQGDESDWNRVFDLEDELAWLAKWADTAAKGIEGSPGPNPVNRHELVAKLDEILLWCTERHLTRGYNRRAVRDHAFVKACFKIACGNTWGADAAIRARVKSRLEEQKSRRKKRIRPRVAELPRR